MYVLTRETLDCFCTEYSGSGAPSAWTLTAMPLKQGILLQDCAVATEAAQRTGDAMLEGALFVDSCAVEGALCGSRSRLPDTGRG
jgi:hypothetical protein